MCRRRFMTEPGLRRVGAAAACRRAPRRQTERDPGSSVSAGLQGQSQRCAIAPAASSAAPRVVTVGVAVRFPLRFTALQLGAIWGVEPRSARGASAVEAHRRRSRCCARNAPRRVRNGRRVRRRPASADPPSQSARSLSVRGASHCQQRRDARRAQATKKPRRVASGAAGKPRNSALSPEDHPTRRTRAACRSWTRRIRYAGAGRRPRHTLPACEYPEPKQHSNASTPTLAS